MNTDKVVGTVVEWRKKWRRKTRVVVKSVVEGEKIRDEKRKKKKRGRGKNACNWNFLSTSFNLTRFFSLMLLLLLAKFPFGRKARIELKLQMIFFLLISPSAVAGVCECKEH